MGHTYIHTCLLVQVWINSSPSLSNHCLWYGKLWGPSQRVVTLLPWAVKQKIPHVGPILTFQTPLMVDADWSCWRIIWSMRLYVVFCNNRRTSEIIEAPLGKPQDTNSAVFLTLFKNPFEHLVGNICLFNDHTPSRFLQFLIWVWPPHPFWTYRCLSSCLSMTQIFAELQPPRWSAFFGFFSTCWLQLTLNDLTCNPILLIHDSHFGLKTME